MATYEPLLSIGPALPAVLGDYMLRRSFVEFVGPAEFDVFGVDVDSLLPRYSLLLSHSLPERPITYKLRPLGSYILSSVGFSPETLLIWPVFATGSSCLYRWRYGQGRHAFNGSFLVLGVS